MAVLEWIERGGLFIWPVLFLAIASAVVTGERIAVLWKARLDAGEFLARLRGLFKNNGPDAVLAYCAAENAAVANVVRQGILRHGRAEEHVSRVLASARGQELFRLRKGIPLLAGIGGVATLVGFLGTVIGVIATLRDVQGLGGAATLADIAGGIWPELLPTAAGLAVGLLCFASERYLSAWVDRLGRDMEKASAEFMDLLAETRATKGEQKSKAHHLPAVAEYEDEFFRRKS